MCNSRSNLAFLLTVFALFALAFAARQVPGNSLRALQQAPECGRITNCEQCYTAKDESSNSVLLCRTCATGYRSTDDGTACECAPGYFWRPSTIPGRSGTCGKCQPGFYCPGGNEAAKTCGDVGLTTLNEGVRSNNFCVTLPGYGFRRTKVGDGVGANPTIISSIKCPENTYNSGSNTLPCRRCPGGLVTSIPSSSPSGAKSLKDCLAGPGYMFDKLTAKPCARGTWKNTTGRATFCTKCPAGLTTAATACTIVSQCVQAMPGYYLRSKSLSTAAAAAGAEAGPVERAAAAATGDVSADSPPPPPPSTAAAAESVPVPGVLCPIGSYNVGFNNVTQCQPCPENMVTIGSGSKSEASCVAPPGYSYDPEAEPPTQPCLTGWFKEGYNRKACDFCGIGWHTDGVGATSKSACFVDVGHGTASFGQPDGTVVTQVLKCTNGLFGYASKTYGAFILPCRACQVGMTTRDAGDNLPDSIRAAITNISPEDCYTLPGWGYDTQAQSAKLCAAGTYNAGWNKEPCQSCSEGYTTPEEGSTSASQCVIAPGWHLDPKQSAKPLPCDFGFYCPGMTLTAAAVRCPDGTSNSKLMAKAPLDCDVCRAGYGSWVHPSLNPSGEPSCTSCPANTFNPRGSRDACLSCAAGTISKPGSDSISDCWNAWQTLNKDFDFLPVQDTGLLAKQPGLHYREEECQWECGGDGCVFYQWDAYSKECFLYLAPAQDSAVGNMQLGLKVDVGVYSVYPAIAGSLGIGRRIPLTAESVTVRTVADCTRSCDEVEACVSVLVTKTSSNAFTCVLRQGEASRDLKTKYRAAGGALDNWVFV